MKRAVRKAWDGAVPGPSAKVKGAKGGKMSPSQVLREYFENSTIHGLMHIAKRDNGVIERVCWLVSVVVFMLYASVLVNGAWVQFVQSPTVTTVATTHLPLYKVPFPAITICPTNRIKRTLGISMLKSYLNVTASNDTLDSHVLQVLGMLTSFQLHHYFRIHEHIGKSESVHDLLKYLNVTDLMLKTTPATNEIFKSCRWAGRIVNSRHMFHLQRTESGFCYSFNSLTADAKKQCSTEEMQVYNKKDLKNPNITRLCFLNRNNGGGAGMGLEVYLKKVRAEDEMRTGSQDLKGYRVMIHNPLSFPDVSKGIYVSERKKQGFIIRVSPVVTLSTERVKRLPIDKRNCYFPDEMNLSLYHDYTQDNCFIECRVRFIAKMCNCTPYFFPRDNVEICQLSNFWCVAHYNKNEHRLQSKNNTDINKPHLRGFSPPKGTLGFDRKSIMNCEHCLPECQETTYHILTTWSEEVLSSSGSQAEDETCIEVYYKDVAAVQYLRDVPFGFLELLVSFGGIMSLFLGISLLSCIEILVYLFKLINSTCKLGYYHFKNKKSNNLWFVNSATQNIGKRKLHLLNPGLLQGR